MPGPSRPRPALSRRGLLRAAGVGAAALAVPTSVSAAAPAPLVLGNACNSTPLLTDPRFPIGIFWPPPPDQTTAANYHDVTAAGFTFMITGNYLLDENIIDYALGIADQTDLKVVVATDPGVLLMGTRFTVDDGNPPMSVTTAEARALVQQAAARYSRHRSFAGFSLYDEPPLDGSRSASLGRATRVIRDVAPSAMPYVNLSYLPSRQAPRPYDDFLRNFVSTVAPPLISFDYYPLHRDGEAEEYFRCWALIRQAGLDSGLPTWTYIQTLSSSLLAEPTPADLSWQVNISLAYGCKGIQYFTYWTPDPARGEGFGPALVNLDGTKTPRYEAAKALNTTWLAPVGRELLPLVSESVVHANETPVPTGASAFQPDAYVRSVTGKVVLGRFRSADPAIGQRWLLVVNRDRRSPVNAHLDTTHAVSAFNPADGTYKPRSAQIDVSLPAGEAALYRLEVS
ncbi:hypothetical protein GCM10029964_056880 [Kibdelosporangium lantanae]